MSTKGQQYIQYEALKSWRERTFLEKIFFWKQYSKLAFKRVLVDGEYELVIIYPDKPFEIRGLVT